jgi:hypothetical protein
MPLPIRRFDIHIDSITLSPRVLDDAETQPGAPVLLRFNGRVVNYMTNRAQSSLLRPFARLAGAELAFMLRDGTVRIISPDTGLRIMHSGPGAVPRPLAPLRWCQLEWDHTYIVLRGPGDEHFMLLRVQRSRIPLAALNRDSR